MKKAKLKEARCDKSPFCGAKAACPSKAITFVREGIFRGRIEIDKDKCIGCSKCVGYCPHNAIYMG